ncbi:hypothetical protein [Burkholderia ambifaria]|jgi:hypothetical protein|uniref:hypothetical protein n=1 Tax=Burkholderia ambifaria TaxID=152480 RepID=UPI00158A0045|nr:hypothetical protein [Burkholderia ambifaria]
MIRVAATSQLCQDFPGYETTEHWDQQLSGGIVFRDLAELHSAILEKDPKDFVSHYLFEPIPFAFGDDLSLWISWKTELAKKIDVDPRDIVLTGSAAIGFSLNPTKNFRPFNKKSDIDCGIISPHHFEVAWRYLRSQQTSWLSLNREVKRAINSHRDTYIFSGTIATDRILALLPFGKAWQAALDQSAKMPPTVGRDVKLRIYKDYDALRQYQAYGIEKARASISDDLDEVAEINIEE